MATETTQDPITPLDELAREIGASRCAEAAGVGCRLDGDALSISVKGQDVGVWRAEGDDLALYRPGSPLAESHATNTSDAAAMTARLVAAAGQA